MGAMGPIHCFKFGPTRLWRQLLVLKLALQVAEPMLFE